MKVVLTKSDLIFRKEKGYTEVSLTYWSIGANTGDMYESTYDYQYAKIGPTRKFSVAEDGVNILPNLGTGVSDTGLIYLYKSNGDYIGYGGLSSVEDGVLIENVLQVPSGYQDQSGQIDKAAAIANAAYYFIGLNKIEAFASVEGKSLKVK